MKVWSTETFTTTKVYVEHNGINYIVVHRDDADGYFVPEWEIMDEDDDEILDLETRAELLSWAKNYLG